MPSYSSTEFESLVRSHNSDLCGYAAGLVGTDTIAEELVQEIWLKLWDRRDSLAVEKDIRGYLYRAVRNEVMTWLRRAKLEMSVNHQELSVTPKTQTASGNTDLSDLQSAANSAIANLPERMREAFLLRRRGLSYDAVGQVMGVSPGTARQQVIAALKKLERELADWLNP